MSDDKATPAAPVRFPVVLASAVGVWACYFALVTIRALVVEGTDDMAVQFAMMGRRGLVSLAGVGVTLLIWIVLRQIDTRSLRLRIVTILLLALPASLATAWVNHAVFSDLDNKSYSLLDDGSVRVERDPNGYYVVSIPGAQPVKVRDPKADDPRMIWKELTDVALGRYFLLIAWGALYLALANAEAVRASERREAELRRATKAAELRSLRYQVNPHFLFNTLNSLSAQVLAGRTADAEAMIQTLATFYRTSLTSDPTADVPLEEEVRLQRLYLEIEGVRFPKRLNTVFDIPEDLADVCVPGLILQPLVENAIKHAVAPTTRSVKVTVAARVEGDILRLSVRDDGPGISTNSSGCGIGLRNVRDRLAARFGEGAQLSVDKTSPGYAVLIDLPLTRQGC